LVRGEDVFAHTNDARSGAGIPRMGANLPTSGLLVDGEEGSKRALLACALAAGAGPVAATAPPELDWEPCGGRLRCAALEVPLDYCLAAALVGR
jgi:hypothetical protein